MDYKQNSKINIKKTNFIQDKLVKRSNTSSSVKKKKRGNTGTGKKLSGRNDLIKDGENYTDTDLLEVEGVPLRTPREEVEDSCQDEKSESNIDQVENQSAKGDNSARVVGSQEGGDTLKSVSSISLEDSVSTALSQVSLKSQKNNVSKVNKSKGNNSRIFNNTQISGARYGNARKNNSDSKTSLYSSSSNTKLKNESLRWENERDDQDEEEERIRVYKINRRKRYLAAAQAKGLGWVANYASTGSPVLEDSGIEVRERETNLYSLKESRKSVNDFSTFKSLGPSHSGLSNGVAVDC